jgi:hypothetical protein
VLDDFNKKYTSPGYLGEGWENNLHLYVYDIHRKIFIILTSAFLQEVEEDPALQLQKGVN